MGEVVLSPLPTPTPLASNDPAQLARGRQLFDEAGCTACHGEDAGGVAEAGPSLLGIGAIAGDRTPGVSAVDYLRASVLAPAVWVAEGYARPGECTAVMSDAQLADLVAYLLTVQ